MPDPYATLAEQDTQVQELIANAMDTRAAEARQQEMLEEYLKKIEFPPSARVLDVGSGTGAITRHIAQWPNIGEIVGLEPAPVLVERAKELNSDISTLRFEEGDGRSLPFADKEFDAVIFHTVLCHMPNSESAVEEAFRVLKPGGFMAVFDGDYVTTTVAISEHDPLQSCVDELVSAFVHDPWLVRRIPSIVLAAGFEIVGTQSHGYVQTQFAGYMKTMVERGADLLAAAGSIGPGLADALKAEGAYRGEQGRFFGHIAYGSLIARKPA